MSDMPPKPAAAAALDYAPSPPARRGVLRRGLRAWPGWLLFGLVGLGVAYGPRAWRRYELLRSQGACLTATLPADRPVNERDPEAARALLATYPGEYRGPAWLAARVDPRWAAFAPHLNLRPLPPVLTVVPLATAFV